MIRLIGRWWPPYLREEVRTLRMDLGREQRKYNKLREAYGRQATDMARLQVEIDRMRLAAGAGPLSARLQARPLPADLAAEIAEETERKRRLDGAGDDQ